MEMGFGNGISCLQGMKFCLQTVCCCWWSYQKAKTQDTENYLNFNLKKQEGAGKTKYIPYQSCPQNKKYRYPCFAKSAFLPTTFVHSFLYLSLHIKTDILISTSYEEKNNFGKSYYNFLRKREFALTCLQTPHLNSRGVSLCVPYAFSVFTLCHIPRLYYFSNISQMQHVMLFFSSMEM